MSIKLTVTKVKDIGARIVKTAFFAFLGVVLVQSGTSFVIDLSDASVALGLTAAFVAVQNLFISPGSTWGRSLSTFAQVFFATWAATGFDFTVATLTAAVAAAIGGVVNFTVKTS